MPVMPMHRVRCSMMIRFQLQLALGAQSFGHKAAHGSEPSEFFSIQPSGILPADTANRYLISNDLQQSMCIALQEEQTIKLDSCSAFSDDVHSTPVQG